MRQLNPTQHILYVSSDQSQGLACMLEYMVRIINVKQKILDFYRSPINSLGATTGQEEQRRRSAHDQAQLAAPPLQKSQHQASDQIYGSVSIADISTVIKALIHNRGLTQLVVLPEEDIRFVNVADTDKRADRIKKIGDFNYEIRIRGHEQRILRLARIRPRADPHALNQSLPSAEVRSSV